MWKSCVMWYFHKPQVCGSATLKAHETSTGVLKHFSQAHLFNM